MFKLSSILKKPNESELAFENEFGNDEIEKFFAENDNQRNMFEKISRFIYLFFLKNYRIFLYSKTVGSSEDKSFRRFYYTRITGKIKSCLFL